VSRNRSEAMVDLSLARDFPPATEAEWLALVEKALKGAPFESLESRSYDGNLIEPLYPPAQGQVLASRQPHQSWTVMQRIDLADPAAANDQIMEDLHNGAPGLVLVLPGGTADYGYALETSKAALERTLDGVLFDQGIEIELNFGPAARSASAFVAALIKAGGVAPASVTLRFGYDPLSALAMGILPKPWAEIAPGFAGTIAELAAAGFRGPFAAPDSRPVHAAGGSEAQELAFVLANGLAYLRAIEAAGVALDRARDYLFFRLAADQTQFLTMAKFRALRKLWARLEAACGLEPKPIFISAETAWRMMAKRDPYGNIVRTTIACAAAALGGANAISVLPYTAALGVPREHARRLARNMQLILIEESNLHQVTDPAAGSGAFEALTGDLCRSAWSLFQQIETLCGTAQALQTGMLQRAIAKTRGEREANVARRKEPIVGTSDFPDLDEDAIEIDPPRELPPVRSMLGIEPLPRYRLTEPYEVLRDRSDAALAATGKRPSIFIAALGRPADFTARATFARSFFAAGGIAAVTADNPVAASGEPQAFGLETVVAGFKASGLDMVCLCSSDRVYAADAARAAKALKAAGAKRIYLAGKPKQDREALERAGIDQFIFQGCDTLAALGAAQAFALGADKSVGSN
jgi:methylmalonyl-CoA mutase